MESGVRTEEGDWTLWERMSIYVCVSQKDRRMNLNLFLLWDACSGRWGRVRWVRGRWGWSHPSFFQTPTILACDAHPLAPWKLMGETSGGNQYLAATGNWCSRSDKHNKAKHCAVAVNSILIGQQRSLRLAQPFTWDFSPSPSSFFSASETPPPTGPWTDMKR